MHATRLATILAAFGLLVCAIPNAVGQQAGAPTGQMIPSETSGNQEFRITRVTPAYWRVTIDHPPFNIFGPESIPMLNNVVTQIENDSDLKVVVFDSAVPGFFLTHYDFVPPSRPLRACARVVRACRRYQIYLSA